MTEDEAKELGALYALGALDAAATREFEEYLRAASVEERREIDEWREAAALLPLALPRPALRPEVKERLLTRLQDEVAPPSEAVAPSKVVPFTQLRRPEPPRWLLIAATVALAALSLFLVWQNLRLREERDALATQVNQRTEELRAKQQALSEIISPATRVVQLLGEAAPQATAQLFWDTSRQQWVIYVYNLPSAPADKDYQLWYITNSQDTISAHIFRPDAQGRSELRLAVPQGVIPRLAATAVTLEPKGGSEKPTGKIYLKGAV